MSNLTKERIETSIEKYIKILSELKKKNSAKTTQIEDLNNQIISFTKELSTEKEKILECEKLKEELKIKEKTLEKRNNLFENEIKKLNDLTNIETYTMEKLDELLKSEELDESEEQTKSVLRPKEELKTLTNNIKPEQKNIEISEGPPIKFLEEYINESHKTYKEKLSELKEILQQLNNSKEKEVIIIIIDYLFRIDIKQIIYNLDKINTRVEKILTFGDTNCTNLSDSSKYCNIKKLSNELKDTIKTIEETYKKLEPIKQAKALEDQQDTEQAKIQEIPRQQTRLYKLEQKSEGIPEQKSQEIQKLKETSELLRQQTRDGLKQIEEQEQKQIEEQEQKKTEKTKEATIGTIRYA
jgi:hypothetical protein